MNSYSLQRDILFDDGCQIYQIESEKDGVCLKYWILAKERTDEFELRIDGLPSIVSELNLDFSAGTEIYEKLPDLELKYTGYEGLIKTDSIVCATRLGLLINEKVRNIFTGLHIDDVEYFPAVLIEENSGARDTAYYFANITGLYSCVD